MQQRAKDREAELLERRRSQSVEQDKENSNFVARRASRRSSASESPEHGRGGDIYERTTEYARRRDSRWDMGTGDRLSSIHRGSRCLRTSFVGKSSIPRVDWVTRGSLRRLSEPLSTIITLNSRFLFYFTSQPPLLSHHHHFAYPRLAHKPDLSFHAHPLSEMRHRRASVREVLLAQELVGCTFAPELQARIRGRSRYRQAAEAIANRGSPLSPPAETSSREERWAHAEDGGAKNRDDGQKSDKGTVYTGLLRGGLAAGNRGRSRQQAKTIVREGGWLSPPPAAAGGVSEEEEAEWDGRGDSSVGTDDAGFSSRPQGKGRPQQAKAVVGQGGWLSPSSAAASGGVSREEAEWDGRGDRSAGVDFSGHRQGIGRWRGGRRSPSEHRYPRQEEQSAEGEERRDGYVEYDDDNEDLVRRRDTVAVGRVGNGTASSSGRRTAGVTVSRGRDGLPPNWTSFTSPEGWEYFHNSQTGVVQWKQPTS